MKKDILLTALREVYFRFCLHAHIVEIKRCGVVDIRCRIHDPINHIPSAIVEEAQGSLNAWTGVLRAQLERVVYLWLEVRIAVQGGGLIVQVREGRQAESLAVGCIQLPVCLGAIGNVDSWVETERVVDGRIHVGNHACRQRPVVE